ncbi:MAG: hypothetical protein HYX55_03800 [Chloroflexi bacterium]|nr:hypothetical protein [Chloroflexota bacterium]
MHVLLGQNDEASWAAAEARRLAAPDDAVTQILWRAAESVAPARLDEGAEVDRLSLEAVAVAADTD